MSYFDVARVIRERLLADSDIVALLAERIHYQVMPDSSTYPHVFFRRTGSSNVADFLNCDGGPQAIYMTLEFVSTQNEELVLGKIVDVLMSIKFATYQLGWQIAFVDASDVDDDYAFVSIGEDIPAFAHGLQLVVYTQGGHGSSSSSSGGSGTGTGSTDSCNCHYLKFVQSSPLSTWVINHNFGQNADVSVFTTGGVQILAEVVQTSVNQVEIRFDTPTAGYAVLQ